MFQYGVTQSTRSIYINQDFSPFQNMSPSLNRSTRRYPWGIQRLVSKHSNFHPGAGGWSRSTETQSAKICPRSTATESAKICPNLHGGGGAGPGQVKPKCQDLSKSTFGGGEWAGIGGWFRPTFLKYLSRDTQGILNQKFWQLECVVHHRESLTHY